MHPFSREVLKVIADNQLLHPGAHIVVGVSGGPDSTALLHILATLRSHLKMSLIAVYVDHGLRPGESKIEAQHVTHFAETLGIASERGKVDTMALAKKKKLSTEHAARELRYDFLQQCAKKSGAEVIAVAHTADDQAEEILLRLIRGAGRKGLSGMPLKNEKVIRPLLPFPKKRILDYLDDRGIRYCTDSSNLQSDFLRNRIRHHLLPYLEEHFDSGIRSSLIKSASNLAEDEALLEELTQTALSEVIPDWPSVKKREKKCILLKQQFCDQPRAIQRRLVEYILWHLKSQARYSQILCIVEAAHEGRTGSELHLSKGLRVGIFKDYLEFSYPQGKQAWRGRLFQESKKVGICNQDKL